MPAREACRWDWMAGLATATMVLSRPTIITLGAAASSVSGGLPRQRPILLPGLAGRRSSSWQAAQGWSTEDRWPRSRDHRQRPRGSYSPDQGAFKINNLAAGRTPGRRPRQDEPGQHVNLERRQLIRPGRGTRFTQVSYGRQAQPGPSPSLIQEDQHWRR